MCSMQSVGAWTALRRWIYSEGFAIKKGDGTGRGKETHLLLNGGRFVLPDNRNAEFLNKYARALFEGEWQYVVEKKTPIFHMMSEFDIKIRDREVNRDEIDAMVRIVQRVMSQAFPETDVSVAVCTAPPKEAKLDDDTPCIQSGLHLIWRVLVDDQTSWQVRAWMLRALEAELRPDNFPLATRWAEAFDSAIFGANGLRMVGSRKAIKCELCDGNSYKNVGEWGSVCPSCQNVGRIDLGRPYDLLYLACSDGSPDFEETERIKRDPVRLVQLTTIRAINPDGTRPESAPELHFPDEDTRARVIADAKRDKSAKRTAPKKGAEKDPVAAAQASEAGKKKRDKKGELVDLSPDDPKFIAISEFLRTSFEGMPVAKSVKQGGGDFYIVNTECHFCLNKGGCHKSSTVYFVVRPKGCVQRCFCVKDAVQPRGGKQCSQFVSPPVQLPRELKKTIFTEGVLRMRRREEYKTKLAESLFNRRPVVRAAEELVFAPDPSTPVDLGLGGDQPAMNITPNAPQEYRSRPLPPPSATGARDYRYRERAVRFKPYYTPRDFADAVSSVKYKIV